MSTKEFEPEMQITRLANLHMFSNSIAVDFTLFLMSHYANNNPDWRFHTNVLAISQTFSLQYRSVYFIYRDQPLGCGEAFLMSLYSIKKMNFARATNRSLLQGWARVGARGRVSK